MLGDESSVSAAKPSRARHYKPENILALKLLKKVETQLSRNGLISSKIGGFTT